MPPRTFSAVDVSEFIHLKIPPRENILTQWLPQQGLAMIYASRGIGKTFIALGIAHAVVTGTSFLKWSAPKPRGVLYLDGARLNSRQTTVDSISFTRIQATDGQPTIQASFTLSSIEEAVAQAVEQQTFQTTYGMSGPAD